MKLARGIPLVVLAILLLLPFHRALTGRGYLTEIDGCISHIEPFATEFPDAKPGPGTFACRTDGAVLTIPSKRFTQEQLLKGRIPLWNPWIFCGTPHQADLYSQVFAVTDTPFLYFMSVDAALTVAIILKLLLLGFGMYLVARRFAIRWEFACIAAIAMCFNFLQIQWLQIPAFLSTMVFLPWMFLAWDKHLTTRRFSWVFLCGILGGFAALGDQGQLLIAIWLILLLYTLFGFRGKSSIRRLNAIGALVVSFVAAVAIAWVQFYPAMEFVGLSRGPEPPGWIGAHFAEAFGRVFAGGWKQVAINFLRLFAPYKYYRPAPSYYSQYNELVLYLGLLSPAIMAALWRRKRSQFINYLWWVCVVSVLAIMFNAIAEMLLGIIPLARFMNLRRMASLAFYFHMALLLPLMLQQIFAEKDARLIRRLRYMSIVGIALIVLYAGYASNRNVITIDMHAPNCYELHFLLFYFWAFLIGLGYATLFRAREIAWRFVPLLLLALFFLEMWNYASHSIVISRTTSDDLASVKIECPIEMDYMGWGYRICRYVPDSGAIPRLLSPNSAMLLSIYDAQGYSPLNLCSYRRLFECLDPPLMGNSRFIPPLSHRNQIDQYQLHSILNVVWVILPKETHVYLSGFWEGFLRNRFTLHGELFNLHCLICDHTDVYEFEMYSSWAFFFYYAENITPDEFYNRLKDGDLILNGVAYITDGYVKGLEPAEADIHEDAIGWPRKSKSKKWVSPKADPIGTDTRLTHEPGFIRAEDIELDRPGVFLFSENNYPGWRVEVDGHRAEILTVDATLMGVQLDAGRHTVEFTFDPPRFRIGLWVSIISLVLAAILGIIGAIRRR